MLKFSTSAAIILLVGLVCRPAPINSASLNSNHNVTSIDNDDDSLDSLDWLALFGNPNAEDPDNFPFTDEAEGEEDFLVDSTADSSDVVKQRVTYHFTEQTKQPNGRPVCGSVLRDVRQTCRRGLCRSGTNVVALLKRNKFEGSGGRTLETLGEARLDFQNSFRRFDKNWANLQVQWNGRNRPRPTSFGNAYIEAGKTFPIRLIRRALVESMQKCVKVWLEVNPKKVPNDPRH